MFLHIQYQKMDFLIHLIFPLLKNDDLICRIENIFVSLHKASDGIIVPLELLHQHHFLL